MNISDYITLFFLIFLVLGAIDRCLGNKFKIGQGFDQGFGTAGGLIIAMVGMTSFAPLIAKWLEPVLGPVFSFFGADPAIFAGMIIANDSGGYPLAQTLANDQMVADYAGLLVASIMGCLLMFTIPVGFSSVDKEHTPGLIKGLLIGIITVPLGLIFGGLFSGLSPLTWLLNTLPVIFLSLLLVLGMWLIPNAISKFMSVFGKILSILLTITLTVSILDEQLDFIHIEGLVPYSDGVLVVAQILVILAGAFPFLNTVKLLFAKPLAKLTRISGLNEEALMGLMTLPINAIPAFAAMNKMNERGIVVVAATAVSMDFVIGDHLAYTLSVAPQYVPMVVLGKVCGGVCALILALFFTRPSKSRS